MLLGCRVVPSSSSIVELIALPTLQLYIILILHPHLGHEGLHVLGQSAGQVIAEFTLEPVLKRWRIHGRWQTAVLNLM